MSETRSDAPVPGAWVPHISYDLFDGDSISFGKAVADFKAWAKEQPRKPLGLLTGWQTLQGEVTEQLLIRNTNNRSVKYPQVLMYATSMVNRRWKKTGQAIITNDREDLEEGQHRLFAQYFTGVPLDTFVVTNVPYEKDLFAYMDNVLPRTGEDALKIAGVNGLSKHLAAVIKDFAIRYDEGLLYYNGRAPINPITNIDVLDYARAHPDLSVAAHAVKDLYQAPAARLCDGKIATFVAWKINQLHGSTVLDEFMNALMDESLGTNHPIAVLRKRLEEHEAAELAPRSSPKKKMRLTPSKILALSIRAFNAMQAGSLVRRLDPRADDPYPQFVTAETETPTAEAAQ